VKFTCLFTSYMNRMKKYIGLSKDLRFLLLLVFVFQLFLITAPPLEPVHSWRQALTNMIARNMIQEAGSLLYPKMDYGGNLTGVMATELPLLQYLISIFYNIFGFNHWIGRLINLSVSVLGIFYFYKLSLIWLKRERLSFYSAIFLLFSIWFSFSRKIMPDTFSVSLAIFALWWLTRFFQTKNIIYLILFITMANIAIMTKIPAALLFAWLPMLLFTQYIDKKQKITLMVGGIMSLIGPLFWYGFWVPYLKLNFEFPLFFPKNLTEGIVEIWNNRSELMIRIFHNGFSSFIASILSFFGLYFSWRAFGKKAIIPSVVIGIIAIFYILKTGEVFATHNYYMIPLVPYMALTASFVLIKIKNRNHKVGILIVGLFILESVSFQWHDFFIRSSKKYMTHLEQESNTITDRTEKIITNGKDNPQLIYFLNKKGWSLKDDDLSPEKIQHLIKHYPSWLLIDKNQPNASYLIGLWDKQNLPIKETENLKAFDLRPLW